MSTSPLNTGVTRFLNDEPSDQDLFGSHQGIADTIYNIVLSSPEAIRNHSIALTGVLGGGKSTVVRLLKKKVVESQGDIRIFIFNTWHHSGDFLRREFLSELLKFFKEEQWISEDVFQQIKKKLTYRITDRTVSTQPLLSWVSRCLLLVCLSFPVLKKVFPDQEDNLPWWLYGCFLLVLFLQLYRAYLQGRPLLSVADAAIGQLWRREPEQQKIVEAVSIENSTSEFINFYSEILFQALVDDAKSTDRSRKVIIVFDDIDRLEPERMRQVCDDLNIFTDYNRTCVAIKKSWIIACFDEKKLEQAFSEREKIEIKCKALSPADTLAIAHSAPSPPAPLPSTPARQFLDKQFLTVLNVPAVLAFEEKKFVYNLLDTAFPDLLGKEQVFPIVYRLFRRSRPTSGSPPRDVVVFVNRLIPLHAAWTERKKAVSERPIPFYTQAIFVLMQSYSLPLEQVYVEVDKALEIYGDIIDDEDTINFAEDFASLVFNRNGLPYAGKIHAAVRNYDANLLERTVIQILSAQDKADDVNLFWFLFEQAIGPVLYKLQDERQSHENIFRAIYLLDPATAKLYEHYKLHWPADHLQRKSRGDSIYESGVFVFWDAWRKIAEAFTEKRRKSEDSQHEKDQIIENHIKQVAALCKVLQSYDEVLPTLRMADASIREFLRLCFMHRCFKSKVEVDIANHINRIKGSVSAVLSEAAYDNFSGFVHEVFSDTENQDQEDEIVDNFSIYKSHLNN